MVAEDFQPAEFARAFQQFLHGFARLIPEEDGSAVRQRMTGHLGIDPAGLPSFSERFDPAEHQNLQLAFNKLVADRPWELIGLPGDARNYGGFSLATLASGRFGQGIDASSPEYVNLPIAAYRTLPCLLSGVYLAWHDDEPVVVLLMAGVDHGPRQGLSVEVLARDAETVRAFITRLKSMMHEINVYRGKLLAYTFTEFGQVSLNFVSLPTVTRADIVLPGEDLDAIEAHTVGISERADALLAAGQHLKRGLLLYGPPGTGKTYSVMYLCNQMPGRTTILLTGPASAALGRAVAIARSLQPSMVVLEDVDLVAMDRMHPGMGTNPLLFQLLNEMDGLASDADIVFVLTTNRADLLEPALASRPGRIDQAVEITLPDQEGRRRLLELYLRGVPNAVSDLDTIAQRAQGSSPAFIRELVRRAVLNATEPGGPPGQVNDDHLDNALTDLLERTSPLTRAILGATPGTDAGGQPQGVSSSL